MRVRPTRRLVAVPAMALVAASAAFVLPAEAADQRQRPPRVPPSDRFQPPPIPWGACDPADFFTLAETGESLVPPTYQCADYSVPLDYDRPRGPQITLALVKRPAAPAATQEAPASEPTADPQGTIFVNPGGPGGSGVEAVAYGGEGLFGSDVLAAFDVVGFDPRGIAGSTGLQCYADNDALLEDLTTNELQAPWPVTDEEYAAAERDARDLAADCRRTAGPIIRHMGTTNVARDLDVLRRAVGDPQLNFIGYSYGTYVCAQYINQYPDRVGAVVCDANIDPVEYATGEPPGQGFFVPNFARARTEVGSNDTLEEFFRLCDTGVAGACAFGPDSKARFEALVASLDATPLDLDGPEGPGGADYDGRDLVAQSNSPLYNSLFGFAFLGEFLAEIELIAAGGTPPVVEPGPDPFLPPVDEAYLNIEGFYGVSCSDNLQPKAFRYYRRAIERSEGVFGPYWAVGDFPCATWPAYDFDTYLGPFDRRTPNPVLVVNTRFDPATPWEDAVDHERRYPNAALLTVEGWGHVGQGLSECGDTIIDTYMLTRTVAQDQQTCTQDITPFSPEWVELFAPQPEAGEAPSAEPVLEAAVDAAVVQLGAGDGGGADTVIDAALETVTEAVVAGLEDAGQDELAEDLRTREAILDQARTGASLTG